jgi:hypothetical protein
VPKSVPSLSEADDAAWSFCGHGFQKPCGLHWFYVVFSDWQVAIR